MKDSQTRKRQRDSHHDCNGDDSNHWPPKTSRGESLVVKATKNKARARWWTNLQVAEIQVMRGNFWKTMGYTEGGKNFLYGEEALFLMEKDQLAVIVAADECFTRDAFYNIVVSGISLECYLTFAKLKTLDYIVRRNGKSVRFFADESKLSEAASFAVYVKSSAWSKRASVDTPPASYVVVIGGEWVPSPLLLLRLLREAEGVPILFAATSPAGHISLQEVSDGLTSLDWQMPSPLPTAGTSEEKDGSRRPRAAAGLEIVETARNASAVVVRMEKPSDYVQTEQAVELAFRDVVHSDQTEHMLVKNLRECVEAFVSELSLVATITCESSDGDGGTTVASEDIVGHVMLTRVKILMEKGSDQLSDRLESSLFLALAPLSVTPQMQRKGIGQRLIARAHEVARKMGFYAIIIVGDPAYYSRFGYRNLSEYDITLPFEVPRECCMALELVEDSLSGRRGGAVEYSNPFM